MLITIKKKLEDVLPYLPQIYAGADTAKEELGFWPPASYQPFAASEKLFVATVAIEQTEIYAGHLMFGGIFPQAKVFQLFVAAPFRGKGIARQLINKLREQLTAEY